MVIDHIPGDVLGHVTLRSMSFSEAAEVFALIFGWGSDEWRLI
jgi:hypothetical protein